MRNPYFDDDEDDDPGGGAMVPVGRTVLGPTRSASLLRPVSADDLTTLLSPATTVLDLRPTLLGQVFPSHKRRSAVKQAQAVAAIAASVRETVQAIEDTCTAMEEAATKRQGQLLHRDAERRLHLNRVAADAARLEADRVDALVRTADARARMEEALTRAAAAHGERVATAAPLAVGAGPAPALALAPPPPTWEGADPVSLEARKKVTLAATLADSDWVEDPAVAFAALAYVRARGEGAADRDARRAAFSDLVALGGDGSLSHADLTRLNASRVAKSNELKKRADAESAIGTLASSIRGE